MKSAKDIAIGAVQEGFGLMTWSRATFLVMLADEGETGTTLRKAVAAVERAIESDRKAHANLRAPS